MNKTFALIVGAVAALAAVPAMADTWTGAYGGTIVSTYANGNVVKVYVNADHTYSIKQSDGSEIKGTWADGGDQSCFTPKDPPPKPGDKPVCFPIKEYKIGDTFSGEDQYGKFTGVIQAGR